MSFKDSVLAAMSGTYCRIFPSFSKREGRKVFGSDADGHPWIKAVVEAAETLPAVERSHLIDGAISLRRWPLMHPFGFTTQATIELGKMTPDLRYAAAWRPMQLQLETIDTADLDWQAVAMVKEALEEGDTRTYLALADPYIAAKAVLGRDIRDEDELVRYITPHFPRLPYSHARRLFMGESPVSLSRGLLTRREAHLWALDGAPIDISKWLSEHLGVPYHRSVKVVRWLHYCRQSGRWPALERPRVCRFAGRTFVRSLLEILDEVQGDDIVTGTDGISTVINRISERSNPERDPGMLWRLEVIDRRNGRFERRKCQEEEDNSALAPVPKWAALLPKGVRLLNTQSDLIREGDKLEHCVGTYAGAVRRGECYILSIKTKDGHSTAELSPGLEVVQHRGFQNSDPPVRNERLLRSFLNRIRKETKDGN